MNLGLRIMSLRILFCGLVGLSALTRPLHAGTLYVVNTLSETVSVVDTARDELIGVIPLGAQGYRIALLRAPGQAIVTTSSGLVIVDTRARRVLRRIPLELSPLANVHALPGGREVVVVTAAAPGLRNEERGRARFVDLTTGAVVHEVALGLNPLDSVMTPEGTRLFVVNWASRDLSVVDLHERRVLDTIPLGRTAARTLVLSPEGNKVFLVQDRPGGEATGGSAGERDLFTNKGAPPRVANRLWEIEVRTLQVKKRPLEEPAQVYALAVAPQGNRLFVLGQQRLEMKVGNDPGSTLDGKKIPTTKSGSTQEKPAPAGPDRMEVVAVELESGQTTRLGAYQATTMTAGDREQLYLIGTPGDRERESAAHQALLDYQNSLRAKLGDRPLPPAAVQNLLNLLKPLTRTLTVLDLRAPRVLKVVPLGSLPNGFVIDDR